MEEGLILQKRRRKSQFKNPSKKTKEEYN